MLEIVATAVSVPVNFAAMATPKLLALTSLAAQVSPHRSPAPPYPATVEVSGQSTPAADLSTAPITPFLTTRTARSWTAPSSATADRVTTASMPRMLAVSGTVKPKPFRRRYWVCCEAESSATFGGDRVHVCVPTDAS